MMDILIFDLFTKKDNSTLSISFGYKVKSLVGEKNAKFDISQIDKLKLKITSNAEKFFFSFSLDGEKYEQLDEQNIFLLSTEVVGGFTGLTIGMFVEGDGSAEFEYFDYQEVE